MPPTAVATLLRLTMHNAPDKLNRYASWNGRTLAITIPDFDFRNLTALLPEGGIPS